MRNDLLSYLVDLGAIVPIGIALYRIKKIDKNYYWILYYLLLDFIFQLSFPFLSNNWMSNVFEVFFDYTSIFCLLILLFKWGFLKNNKLEKRQWIILFIFIAIMDLVFQKNSGLRPPWMFILGNCIWMVLALKYISIIMNRTSPVKLNRPILLIIIPLVCLIVYYTVLQILMTFLFTKQNQQFFRMLYKFIIMLRIATFICFSLALIWAPKKEINLELNELPDSPQIVS